jgi:hypothetical protein
VVVHEAKSDEPGTNGTVNSQTSAGAGPRVLDCHSEECCSQQLMLTMS